MNDQTFERLLIDDALGALTPDQSELLAAYTSATGSDSQRLIWRRVAAAARLALPAEPARNLPQFPARALRIHQFWRLGSVALAAAAILVLGIGLGARIFSQTPAANPTTVVVSPPPPSRSVAATAGVSDIWSSSRLVAIALQRQNGPVAVTQWTSVFR
jgi:hypothetical protein